MFHSKLITGAVACSFLICATAFTAFAAPVSYPLCGVEGCYETGDHYHDGTCYQGHYNGDGHSYHQACSVSGCQEYGSHNHNNSCYIGHQTRSSYSGGHHSGHRGHCR